MIHFVVPAAGGSLLRDYLAAWGRNLAERVRILDYENLPSQTRFDRGTYILAALDQLSPGMLRLVGELYDQLSHVDGFRILNHPTRTLRRFDLLAELRRLNRNEFRAARAAADLTGLRYPVFLRSERSHGGALSPLLRSAGEVEAEIGRALVRGFLLHDLLVVEFCDTAGQDGYYRKYAAFIVGDRIMARHLFRGREWMLKWEAAEFSRSTPLEERDYVLQNPHQRQLAEIFEVARVEYGRIDYAVRDGQVQTWEINLSPTIGRGLRSPSGRVPAELEPLRREAREHFYRCFEAALEAVDLTHGGSAVGIVLDSRTIRAARSDDDRRGRFLKVVRNVLRPAKPLLDPLATRLFPLLGRLARHGRA
jgi:hypothetical protein